jgi:hypothetical protein
MNITTLERPVEQKFELTTDQKKAMEDFQAFLLDPTETVFVLSGYSGCGKSTLIRQLLDEFPGFMKIVKLVNPSVTDYQPVLTATTNKAAENLSQITGYVAGTIHSAIGLRIETNFKTSVTTLVEKKGAPMIEDSLLFIDEASFIDGHLLDLIFKKTVRSKIVFIGDPAQLTPVKSSGTPVFTGIFKGAHLSQVVRQAELNPIVDLSTQFRHTVNTGVWPNFTPDGHHIQHMDRGAFMQKITEEFTRPNWKYADSKILAWTNKCVIKYNEFVRNQVKGDPHFQVDDYAVCNSFVTVGRSSIKTDQLVQITHIEPDGTRLDVAGNWMTLDRVHHVFQPKSLAEKNAAIRLARKENRLQDVIEMETQWTDLRGAYSCTVNKAQGSTFDSVFIDLSDISGCSNGETMARMLYVAVSRARNHVYLTGDLA